MNFFGNPAPTNRLGSLGDGRNINEQLHALKGRVDTTMLKNKAELKKYRELSKFNEQLSQSYVANLRIIVDISNLLNSYNEFFEIFKTRLAEIDQELGIPISSDDFDYLRRLTTEQMSQLNTIFKNETMNLKRMYSRYGRQKEYNDVEMAERLYDQTKSAGETAYVAIKSAQQQPPPVVVGGKKKSSTRQPKKKTEKK
jgi:hypothetical protein